MPASRPDAWVRQQSKSEEEEKIKRMTGILNKLTVTNFDKLSVQIVGGIDSAFMLKGIVWLVFDKALQEQGFSTLYADLCVLLSKQAMEFQEDDNPDSKRLTFKRCLLNKCQEEFEKGGTDAQNEELFAGLTPEEREVKEIRIKRRMLGNIKFVGELFSKGMLNEKIMHACVQQLLRRDPKKPVDEDQVESLCKLLTTIGKLLDHEKARQWMDTYFGMLAQLESDVTEDGSLLLPNRLRFMIRDVRDLRSNKWVPRKLQEVKGPKHINDIRREAAMEQQQPPQRGGGGGHGPQGGRGLLPPPRGGGGGGNMRDDRRGPRAEPDRRHDGGRFQTGEWQDVRHGERRGGQGGRDMRGGRGDDRREDRGMGGRGGDDRPRSWDKDDRGRGPPQVQRQDSKGNNNSAKPALSEEQLENKVRGLLDEYYESNDETEAVECVKELGTDSKHTDLLVQMLSAEKETSSLKHADKPTRLIQALVAASLMNKGHLQRGLEEVWSFVDDVAIDVPFAPAYLGRQIGDLIACNLTTLSMVEENLTKAPESGERVLGATLARLADGIGPVATVGLLKASSELSRRVSDPAVIKAHKLERLFPEVALAPLSKLVGTADQSEVPPPPPTSA